MLSETCIIISFIIVVLFNIWYHFSQQEQFRVVSLLNFFTKLSDTVLEEYFIISSLWYKHKSVIVPYFRYEPMKYSIKLDGGRKAVRRVLQSFIFQFLYFVVFEKIYFIFAGKNEE